MHCILSIIKKYGAAAGYHTRQHCPPTTHPRQLTAFSIIWQPCSTFRFRSSDNPAFSCPPHFLLLSLMHSLSLSPKSLHASHTLFCREVHSPSSRSRCGLAGKRTINLRAILLLYLLVYVITSC
jgi:hypothetical protein